jgi:hypothetical protein
MKDFQAAGEAFSPPKRTCISSKHEISSLFPYFVSQFCSPGSGSGSGSTNPIESGSNMDPDPDPDPDPQL